MIHINREKIRAEILKCKYNNKNWLDEATKALDEVKSLPAEKRAKAIEERSYIWKAVKNALCNVSNGKCWYCETKEARHDDEVDHQRPKNAVCECKEHPGYWWLAFDWENFRYACAFCNQRRKKDKSGNKDEGGKGAHFPLLNPDQRVSSEENPLDLLREKPVLLDPTVRKDTYLLRFEIDGTAQPSKTNAVSPDEYRRAYASIEIYHLNANDLVEKRRTNICNQVERLISEGDIYYYCLSQCEANIVASKAYAGVVDQLSYMIDDEHEYSMAAKSVIIHYRGKYLWLKDVLGETT